MYWNEMSADARVEPITKPLSSIGKYASGS